MALGGEEQGGISSSSLSDIMISSNGCSSKRRGLGVLK